jgi:multidrug efflux system membrane fusion protein
MDDMKLIFQPAHRLVLLCAGGLLLTAGCSKPEAPSVAARYVRVSVAHYQPAVSATHYAGEVRARYESPLAFRVGGKLEQRRVDVGAVVKRGDVLATLDPADYRLNEAETSAQLTAARAELSQAQKDLHHSEVLLEKKLFSEAGYERRQDSLRAAEARVARLQSALGLNARQTAYAELRADQPGVVTSVEAEAGQVLNAGQAVVRLARTDQVEIVINVVEGQCDNLRPGGEARVSLWAYPGHFYNGRIREIAPSADPQTRTFSVKISVINPDELLRFGMTATVELSLNGAEPWVDVPLTALDKTGDTAALWIVDPVSHAVQKKPVMLDSYENTLAHVRSGVAEGDLVVSAGVHKLLPGEKVQVLGADGVLAVEPGAVESK